MELTDTALIEKWKSTHDPDAFTELVTRHSAMVYRAACRILRDTGHAEEVAQECFILLAQKPATVRRSPAGWLHALAVSRALNRLRAERRRLVRESRYADQASMICNPQWDDVQGYVDEAVASLPETLRETVVYRYLEGHSLDETAQRLSLSRSTVQTRLEKAVGEIRRFLKRRGVAVPVSTLIATLGVGSAEAAPATLTLALGKLALAGTTGSTAISVGSGVVLTGGLLVMKKVLIVAGIIFVAAFLAKETLFKPTVPTSDASPAIPKSPPAVPTAYLYEKAIENAPEETSQSASARGTIFDPQHKPISGAQITAVLPGKTPESGLSPQEVAASATTNSDGTYSLDDLPTGHDLVFIVEHPDWSIGGGDLAAFSNQEVRKNVDFTLRHPVEVRGVVLSAEDAPIAGATVFIKEAQDPEMFEPGSETKSLFAMGNRGLDSYLMKTETDVKGQFVFTHIPENVVLGRIGAAKDGYAPGWAVSTESWKKREQTGNGRWSAQDITLPCGELRIVLQQAGSVTGKVILAASHTPVPDTEVHIEGTTNLLGPLSDAFALFNKTVRTDSNGLFTLRDVPAGDFNVFAKKETLCAPSVRVSVARGFATDNVLLALNEEGIIEGHLYDAATEKAIPDPHLLLHYIQEKHAQFIVVRPDTSGFYQIKGLAAGTVRVGPRLPYQLSKNRHPTINPSDTMSFVDVPVKPGMVTKDVNLYCEFSSIFAAKFATIIRGKVFYSPGKTASGVTVSIKGHDTKVVTNEDGTYVLTSLNPGAFTLYAMDEKSRLYGQTEVTLEQGKEKHADIYLNASTGHVTGKTVYKDGRPARIPLVIIGLENNVRLTTFSNKDGFFAATLLPGRYAVSPTSEGNHFISTPSQQDITVGEGEEVSGIDFTLDSMQGSLSGTVVYSNGSPAKSITVIARGNGVAARALTDAAGNFFIHPIDGTDLSLEVVNPLHDSLISAHVSPVSSSQNDIRIVLNEPGRLTATIVAPGEKPGELLQLYFYENTTKKSSSLLISSGKMDLSVAPGAYSLRFSRGETQVTVETTVVSGTTNDLGEIRLDSEILPPK